MTTLIQYGVVKYRALKWAVRLGIRQRLILLVLALGLPFLVYVALSAVRQSNIEREHARQEMLAAAQLTAARLDDQIGNIQQLIATLARVLGPNIQDSARNDALLRSLAPQLPAHLNNVALWTRAGENIGTLDPQIRVKPFNIADRRYFKEALHAHGLVVEAPLTSRANGEAIAIFAFPLLDGDQVVGVVSVSTKLKPLQTLLDPQGSLPHDAVIAVVNADHVIVARSIDPDRWIGRTVPLAVDNISQRFAQRTGAAEAVGLDHVRRTFGFATTKAIPWLVFVGIPTEVALAPVRARLYENLALGGAILLVGLLLAAWFAEQIARPLRQLSQDAATLGKGMLSHRSGIAAVGEIGLLVSTLNQMAEALQERTVALQRSEERFQQITDNLPALISSLDTDQRFCFANRAYRDWLGVEPQTLLGHSLRDLYGEEAYAVLRPHIEKALTGTRVMYERELSTLRGPRHVHVTVVPQSDAAGTVASLYVLIYDITERHEAELSLARSEERLSLALEGSGQSLFDWDIAANRIYFSAQASIMRGGPAEQTQGTPAEMSTFVHPDDLDALRERQRDVFKGLTALYHAEYRVRTVTGGWIWMRSRGRVVERDAAGRALRLAGTDADISQRKETEERLRHLAEFDILTGLPNRALFQDRLQQALMRAAHNAIPVTLMYLDIDYFKHVNDTLGHEAGDELLQVFAQRLSSTVRKSDTVARLAGDEFTVTLEEVASFDDLCMIVRKLMTAIRGPVILDGREIELTASVGVARAMDGELDGAALIRRADAALYEAKRRGRNQEYFDVGPGCKTDNARA